MNESSDDDDATVKGKARYFACPFYRNNAVRHSACLSLRMVRIRDVKQHLQRRHSEPRYYCSTCYKRFETELEQSQHVQSQSAVLCSSTDEEFDFVPPHAKDLLKSKVSRKDTAEEQWYTVWDKIFEPKPRPYHPYMGTVIEEVSSMLQKFWQHEGDQIVSRFMETRQVQMEKEINLKDTLKYLMEESHHIFGRKFRFSQAVERSIQSSSNEELCGPRYQASGSSRGEDTPALCTMMTGLDQESFESLSHDLTSQHFGEDEEDNRIWSGIYAGINAKIPSAPEDIDFAGIGTGTEEFNIDFTTSFGCEFVG
ncbi:hypothetical protein CORC01_11843 [Colletotrichum orchidophilum]|uniref:C2H2-type domain-containing protein n=1 Tax=Colletotrichum orchidophilum TaxID=1209926 RepID=A0A1G4AUJ3_9PEZI|nr:uncharacterized protein CORC01_11843 [Colletotrichum orchidophilum]OHE92837.1 hypothetical protein CORC01_11843 [Colletotrichum orchidophilum]